MAAGGGLRYLRFPVLGSQRHLSVRGWVPSLSGIVAKRACGMHARGFGRVSKLLNELLSKSRQPGFQQQARRNLFGTP